MVVQQKTSMCLNKTLNTFYLYVLIAPLKTCSSRYFTLTGMICLIFRRYQFVGSSQVRILIFPVTLSSLFRSSFGHTYTFKYTISTVESRDPFYYLKSHLRQFCLPFDWPFFHFRFSPGYEVRLVLLFVYIVARFSIFLFFLWNVHDPFTHLLHYSYPFPKDYIPFKVCTSFLLC